MTIYFQQQLHFHTNKKFINLILNRKRSIQKVLTYKSLPLFIISMIMVSQNKYVSIHDTN